MLFIRVYNYPELEPSLRNLEYRFEGVVRTVICSMLQTISHRTAAHLSSSYLPATVRGSVDRAPAASLNKRWNSILYLRLAIEGCDLERGKRPVGARTVRRKGSVSGRKEEERDRELTILPVFVRLPRGISSASVTR